MSICLESTSHLLVYHVVEHHIVESCYDISMQEVTSLEDVQVW
jgi:hypothetical protein